MLASEPPPITVNCDDPHDRAFAGLTQLNCDDGRREAGQRHRMSADGTGESLHLVTGQRKCRGAGLSPVTRWFPGDALPHRLARALAARHAIDMKEFCESFEFFTRVRRHLRRAREMTGHVVTRWYRALGV